MSNIYTEVSELSNDERALLELLLKQEGLELWTLPIPRRGQDDPIPLSNSQSRLWLSEQLTSRSHQKSPFTNMMAYRVNGVLDPGALRRSFEEVLRRHEILRTTCSNTFGEPVQVVAPVRPFELPIIDLRGLSPDNRESEAIRVAEQESRRSFDLVKGPLLRSALIWLAEEEYVLLLSTHTFVADGRSLAILLRELGTHYDGFLRGESPNLPEPVIQYGDFALWQRQYLQGEALSRQLGYWKERLRHSPAGMELQRRSRRHGYSGATRHFTLSEPLSRAIRSFGREQGATMFMLFLAGLQALLHRYTRQDQTIVGTVVSNRSRSETESLIGSFSNTLLLGADHSSNPTFSELLDQVRETAIGAYANQDLPYEVLAEELYRDPSIGRVPIPQVVFVFHESMPNDNLKLAGVTLRDFRVEQGTSIYDLYCRIAETQQGISGSVEYSTDLFDAATVDSLLKAFEQLLETAVARPHLRLSEMSVGALDSILGGAGRPRPNGARVRAHPLRDAEHGRPDIERPHSQLEYTLIGIWEELLGVRGIGVSDDFFELGGNSILAIGMFARIERLVGKRLPMAVLFGAPSIRKLAAIIEGDHRLDPWSPLVAIQTKGTRPPFFVVHGAGGGVLFYSDLAKYLGPDQPLYGLQAPGFDGEQEPRNDIESMASEYVEVIQKVQPKGPYYLGGLSMGGLVAFEIAQRLVARGEDVRTLALFDTQLPSRFGWVRWNVDRLVNKLSDILWRRAIHHCRKVAEAPAGHRIDYVRNLLTKTRSRLRSKFHESADPAPRRDDSRTRLHKTNVRAASRYVPAVYAGRIVQFLAEEQPVRSPRDPRLRWGELAQGGIDLHIVPGDHTALVRGPNARILAEKLRSCLQ